MEKLYCHRLKLYSIKQYVNAGVLVLNFIQIRKENKISKFIELTKANYSSQDQDILNVACYGKILVLTPKYDAMVRRLKENWPLLRKLYNGHKFWKQKMKHILFIMMRKIIHGISKVYIK